MHRRCDTACSGDDHLHLRDLPTAEPSAHRYRNSVTLRRADRWSQRMPVSLLRTSGCITAGTSCSVSCVGVLLQTGASPTPQAGYAALTGASVLTRAVGLWLGPAPTPAATYMPNAITVTEGASGCGSGDIAAWGTTSSQIEGVAGEMFSVQCGNGAGGPWFNVNSGGVTGFYSNMKCCAIGTGAGLLLDSQDLIKFATTSGNCELIAESLSSVSSNSRTTRVAAASLICRRKPQPLQLCVTIPTD